MVNPVRFGKANERPVRGVVAPEAGSGAQGDEAEGVAKDSSSPAPAGGRRGDPLETRGHHNRPVAKLLYRASTIIKLDRKHPGLRALVDERMRQRIPHVQVRKEILERYGERVTASVLSNYWQRQAGPEELEIRAAYKQAHGVAEALLEEAEKHPGSDAWKIVSALIEAYIFNERQKLGEADVMELVTEQRRRKELEIKRGHLEVAIGKLENEKKDLDDRLEAGRAQREQVLRAVQTAEAAAREGDPFNPEDVYAKIAAVISGEGAAEERIEQ
jgi:hypothetical protein